MKKIYTLLVLVFSSIAVNAQTPNWAWARGAGGALGESAYSTTTDASGNVYVTGYYYSDSISFGTFTLINSDSTGNTNDIFIVKYDGQGNTLWAKSAGGTDNEYAWSITSDDCGSVYITGSFNSPFIAFGADTLFNSGGMDMFIVKYDALGNLIWANNGGSSQGNVVPTCITVDASCNVFVTGYYTSTGIFGTTTLINAGVLNTEDIFTVKYDSLGYQLFVRSAGSQGGDIGNGITTDDLGNVYVTGYFSNSVTFGTTVLTSVGNQDIFIVKYDSIGNVIWAKGEGSTGSDYGQAITSDTYGNVIVTGAYLNNITFGTIAFTNSGMLDFFAVKYDAFGNVLWAKNAGGAGHDIGMGIRADNSGNLYIMGTYYSSSITFGTTILNNAGSNDMFILKYDTSGNVLWVEGAGAVFQELGRAIAIDTFGNVYVTGEYGSPSIDFGITTLTNVVNTGLTSDMFIAKLAPSLVGFKEKNATNEINIYPNPGSGIFTFRQYTKTVEIYNTTGELILTDNNTNQINLEAFPKGMYVARINGEQVSKLIKE